MPTVVVKGEAAQGVKALPILLIPKDLTIRGEIRGLSLRKPTRVRRRQRACGRGRWLGAGRMFLTPPRIPLILMNLAARDPRPLRQVRMICQPPTHPSLRIIQVKPGESENADLDIQPPYAGGPDGGGRFVRGA